MARQSRAQFRGRTEKAAEESGPEESGGAESVRGLRREVEGSGRGAF